MHLACYDQVEQRLKKHLPSYDKAALRFGEFAPGVPARSVATRTAFPTGTVVHQLNPSTDVWKVVDRIMSEQ